MPKRNSQAKLHWRRSTMKDAPGQLHFVLSRQEKFALLRGAKFTLPKSKVRNFSRVYDLLEQIELKTGSDGCRARISNLAEAMHCSVSTATRTIKLAEDLGVLAVGRDWDQENQWRRKGGCGPNWYKVYWDKVRQYCDAETRSKADSIAAGRQSKTAAADKSAPERKLVSSESGWAQVGRELQSFGVHAWGKAIDTARRIGLTAPDVMGLLAYAGEKPERYWDDPPAVLFHRICNASLGASSAQHWPPPSESWSRQQRRNAESAQRQAEAVRESQESIQVKATVVTRDRREAEFGPILDAMSDPEALELARTVFRGSEFMVMAYQSSGRGSVLCRQSLLAALEKRRGSHVHST